MPGPGCDPAVPWGRAAGRAASLPSTDGVGAPLMREGTGRDGGDAPPGAKAKAGKEPCRGVLGARP